MTDLLAKGYKKVKMPLFDEYNEAEVALQKKIIASYANQKVVFVAEQDQYYKDQFGVIDAITHKFNTAPARSGNPPLSHPCSTAPPPLGWRRTAPGSGAGSGGGNPW